MNNKSHITRIWTDLLLLIMFIAGCLLSPAAISARHALLVGVGDYPQSNLDLLGPENDINALENILKENWDFKPENVQVLMDKQATKAAVLQALRSLKQRSQPGDQLFFYFSGHGTSASDEAVRLPLPDMTAGLLPYDAKLNLAKHEIVASLIVGRTDLRPIFKDIDQSGRQLLVMIDACYSGNAVRSLSLPGEKMRSRFVQLDSKVDTLLPDASQIQTRSIAASASEEAYPYRNVFFISASGEYEEAADISGPYLQKFPTIDGKPHGAFSDAMLRVLSGKYGNADSNGDQRVSHLETKQAIQDWMTGKFPQTPQHLPPAEEDVQNLASRSIFGIEAIPGTILKARPEGGGASESENAVTVTVNAAQVETGAQASATTQQSAGESSAVSVSKEPTIFRIAVSPELSHLVPALQALPGIELSDIYPDIRIVPSGESIDLRNGANDLMISYPPGFNDELIARVEQEIQVDRFFKRLKTERSFDISVDVRGKQNNGPHLGGEFVSFSVQSSENAYLLLLDIDREGGINILFPSFRHEQRLQPSSLVLETDEIEVVPPYGTDNIVAIGFLDKPSDLYAWMGELTPRISPRTSRLVEFYNLVNRYSAGSAIQELQFVTVSGD